MVRAGQTIFNFSSDLFFRRQHQDQVAGLDVVALLDRQLVDDAADAGGQHRALVGFGQAGDADDAGVLVARRLHHLDDTRRRGLFGLRLLRLGLARFAGLLVIGGRTADRRELAGADPGCEADEHHDGGKLVKPEFRHRLYPLNGLEGLARVAVIWVRARPHSNCRDWRRAPST